MLRDGFPNPVPYGYILQNDAGILVGNDKPDGLLSIFHIPAVRVTPPELLLNGIGECAGCRQYRGLCAGADEALVREAHRNGLSFGKYRAYLALRSEGVDITPEAWRGLSMAELRSLMRKQDAAGGGDGACTATGRRRDIAGKTIRTLKQFLDAAKDHLLYQ